jgi:hypothetical protein
MSMTVIQHTELASSAASIVLNSIPQDYDDLLLLVSLRSDRTDAHIDAFYVYLNGTSGAVGRRLYSVNSESVVTNTPWWPLNAGNSSGVEAGTYGNGEVYIHSYADAKAHVMNANAVSQHNNNTQMVVSIGAGQSVSTSAVTSITIDSETGANFIAGCTATLYGITSGSDGTTTVS